jgi:hypothetical protein
MSNNIKQEMNKIEIPKELHERSKVGILQAKKEIRPYRIRYWKTGFVAVASLLILFVSYTVLFEKMPVKSPKEPTAFSSPDGSVTIPGIKLPEENSSANMIGLIVYNNKIYTQTQSEIISKNAKAILGEKIGRTKSTIDEWSSQEAYNVEFGSSIGETDVYSVKGYDKDFRIMTYEVRDGKTYAELYENLNDITIKSGEELFGKLKISGNVKLAHLRYYSDFYYGTDNYKNIANKELIASFLDRLNKSKPVLAENLPLKRQEYYNDERFRELTVYLYDGTKVRLTLFEGGFVHYGYMPIYFKMDDIEVFNNVWIQLPLTE